MEHKAKRQKLDSSLITDEMDEELVSEFTSSTVRAVTAVTAVPSSQHRLHFQPPPPQPCLAAIPKLNELKICIVGDSGLTLRKAKGKTSFKTEIRRMMSQNVDVVSFPGGGAASIIRHVDPKSCSANAVVAVWFLNELFTKSSTLVEQYPLDMDGLAQGLAAALSSFPYRAAVIGGSSRLWRVCERFDGYADRVRSIVSSQGIHVVNGFDAYAGLEFTEDRWHVRDTPKNKVKLASYFQRLVCQLLYPEHD